MPFDINTAKPDAGFDLSSATPVESMVNSAESPALDTANAIGTGFNKGMLRLAGLAADTGANIVDLGKAAIGAPYIAATGKAPPNWLQIGDRANILGSGENLINSTKNIPLLRNSVTPSNPAYENGYAEAFGGGLTGIINPQSRAEAITQAALSVGGALAGKKVYDTTGNAALAVAAGMSPMFGLNGVIGATKYAVRGGESGRRLMEQRIADLKNAGIDNPTMGLASGNSSIGGLENLLQQTPGAIKVMSNSRDAALTGLQNKVASAADLASTNRGSVASGVSIQKGAKTFQGDVKDMQGNLYNNLSKFIPDQFPVAVGNTRSTLSALNEDIATMPQLSRQFKNSRIQSIEDALNSDMSATTSKALGSSSLTNEPAISRTTIPFEAVKKVRTLVGKELADNSMLSDVPRSKWNPLYGALSDDMSIGAASAGNEASATLNRANNYTRSSLGRLERIAPVVDRVSPEDSFRALNSTLKDNVTTFQAVKKSLPDGARGDFAGTVIERLGIAKPGQQDAAGGQWNPETFLSNWNGMSPAARTELLSGFKNSAQVAQDVNKVAESTAKMRVNSKMWANPSGTGANVFARTALGGLGLGSGAALMGIGSPLVPMGAAAGIGGANLLARALTSKNNVNSMAARSNINNQIQQSQINQLFGSGLLDQGR